MEKKKKKKKFVARAPWEGEPVSAPIMPIRGLPHSPYMRLRDACAALKFAALHGYGRSRPEGDITRFQLTDGNGASDRSF